jgi:predicted nucleotidyltransferase
MLQKDNRNKVLSVFFEDPLPEGIGFQLREISRNVKIAPPSVKNYLLELEKENLIIKSKHRIYGYPVYLASRDNENFKFLKRIDNITKIKESNLLEHIYEKCMPNVIILFGSCANGEDLKNSDIDLFIQAKEEKLDLSKYEKVLNKRINLFFNNDFNKLSKELKNNILNGIILKGYLKVFD